MSLLFVSVQYLSYIYHYVKEWRKNPELSLSCCLALLLPLRNLRPRQQLQTDRIDTTSTANTGRDNGAVDITLEDYDSERKEKEEEKEQEQEQEVKEQEQEQEQEEEEEEEEDTANRVEQGVLTLVQVIVHHPPSGIQDTKL